MKTIDIISIFLFICFAVVFLVKLLVLRRRDNINANVLAKRAVSNGAGKGASIIRAEIFVKISTSVWIALWILESLFSTWISGVLEYIFHSRITSITGIILLFSGVAVFSAAALHMRTSWRVGIDKETKTTLITDGIYKLSRNPAFAGFDLMFAGLFLTYANILTFTAMIWCMLSLHFLILQEEKHLMDTFGLEYEEYRRKVPRYLIRF